MMFDRVILLSEGYTIYSGPPSMVKTYFEQYGLKMSRFSNPADKLSQLASEPRSVLNDSVTIINLHDSCKKQLADHQILNNVEREEICASLTTNLSLIGK